MMPKSQYHVKQYRHHQSIGQKRMDGYQQASNVFIAILYTLQFKEIKHISPLYTKLQLVPQK
jgi:acyl-CoA thioesterase